jgi:hypothetical protein
LILCQKKSPGEDEDDKSVSRINIEAANPQMIAMIHAEIEELIQRAVAKRAESNETRILDKRAAAKRAESSEVRILDSGTQRSKHGGGKAITRDNVKSCWEAWKKGGCCVPGYEVEEVGGKGKDSKDSSNAGKNASSSSSSSSHAAAGSKDKEGEGVVKKESDGRPSDAKEITEKKPDDNSRRDAGRNRDIADRPGETQDRERSRKNDKTDSPSDGDRREPQRGHTAEKARTTPMGRNIQLADGKKLAKCRLIGKPGCKLMEVAQCCVPKIIGKGRVNYNII